MGFDEWLNAGSGYIIALAAFLTAVGVIYKFGKGFLEAYKRPIETGDQKLHKRIDEMEKVHKQYDKHNEHIDTCLKRDKDKLDRHDEILNNLNTDMKMTMRGVMHLMSHEIDGGSTDKLIQARDDIHEHLINR